MGAKKAYEDSIAALVTVGTKAGKRSRSRTWLHVLYKLGDSRHGEGLFEESIKLAHEIGISEPNLSL